MRYGFVLSLFMIPALPAISQSAIVTFEPEAGRFSDLGPADGYGVTGTWQEAGFDVGFDYEGPRDNLGYAADTFLGTPYLNDSGCCFGVINSLDFSRRDGKSFSLDEIDIYQTTSSWFAEASFTPYAPDGSLDYGRQMRDSLSVAYDNILFTGRKSDGALVEAAASSYFASDFLGGVGGPDRETYQTDAPLRIEGDLAEALSDLDALRVEVDFGSELDAVSREAFYEEFYRTALAISDVDPIYGLGLAQCLAAGKGTNNCSFEDFGVFDFFADNNVMGNYGSAVIFDAFDFSVGGGAPSAVPVPASLPLLIGGLGLVGAVRSRRRPAA